MKDRMNADTDEWAAETRITKGGARKAPPIVAVDVAGQSHQGLVRPNNEDHFVVVRLGRFLERLQSNLPAGDSLSRFEEITYGFGVADGIGGSAGGEVASRIALDTLNNLILDVPDWIFRPDDDIITREIVRRAAERYEKIKEKLKEHAIEEPRLHGYGTTMTVAWNLGKNLFVGHIGDSRAYLHRQHKLCQLTRDHTMAQALADHGQVSQAEVAKHRLRHVLTRSLGDRVAEVKPDIQQVVLDAGDRLLLCSDGLTDMISDSAIAAILDGGETAEKTCKALVDAALAAGGKDNVTVIVARYDTPHKD
jgi:protein phosphatase